jgi:succinyl-CoA synthetase alpha subunit
MALKVAGEANMALISTPGDYAAAEAMKALRLGLNVMLFSNNVAVEEEFALKQYAREQDLIVMGPDCGTAIINGTPLAFANVVKRGPVGVVGASGTGLQQVTVLVDRLGSGISQAIGTGGRDLAQEIGGISMLKGLKDLATDPATQVIVLISKPPAPAVAEHVLAEAARAGKPVVVVFLGADPQAIARKGVHAVKTLEDAARAAVAIVKGENPAIVTPTCRIYLPDCRNLSNRNATYADSTAEAHSATRRRCCWANFWARCTRIHRRAMRTNLPTPGRAIITRWSTSAMTCSPAAARIR